MITLFNARFKRHAAATSVFMVALLSGINLLPMHASTLLIVNTPNDNAVVDGKCSLREAIMAANTGQVVDACLPLVGNNQIHFDVSVPAVNVTSPLPLVAANTTLLVNPDNVTEIVNIDSALSGSIFMLPPGANLTLQRLNFQNTNDAYCVNSAGAVRLVNVNFSACTKGLVALSGQVNIDSSVGKAVSTVGAVNLTILDSTFEGTNAVAAQVAVSSNSTATILRSTFISAPFEMYSITSEGTLTVGRSIFKGDGLEAINLKGSASITNSIIAGTGVGLQVGDGAGTAHVTITNSTIVGHLDGMAIGPGSNLTLRNTILKNTHSDCDNSAGRIITDDGNNTQFAGGCGNIPIVAPMLNGNLFPLPGSPVIDAGKNNWCPQIDILGVARPIDGNGDSNAVCDIGAYEYHQ